jgi:4,5-dihydroxyphthalate decarboxylase
MPRKAKIEYLKAGQNISDMLESEEMDAAFSHQAPACFQSGSAGVRRLFPDYKTSEIDYYQRTGIHPNMHCGVLRKDLYKRHPWALRSLCKALFAAKNSKGG